ncbi:MAG TPA: aldose epimerase family protein [Thiolinea sp.]|nr:aldose epimerase family protein [Thiolinea sp.]
MQVFGVIPDGQAIHSFELTGGGLTARVLTLGGALQDLRLAGVPYSLVLGFPDLNSYLHSKAYIGANVGRFANRIAQGRATIAGQNYQFDTNFLGKHLLHGGSAGADRQVWTVTAHSANTLSLQLVLADGEMGFPGELTVELHYRLLPTASLEIEFVATTGAPTLCNFAHHSYFNLDGGGSIQDHQLKIAANHYLPVDAEAIPTGEIAAVENTAFDFRELKLINWQQAQYDHNFCTADSKQALRPVAYLQGQNGVSMTLATTEPGLQLYDGQHLDGGFAAHAGLALEPQAWPDAPNHAHFPSAELLLGQVYRQVTRYSFSQAAL